MADPGRSPVLAAERMRDHWWWRPGWRPGRRLYTWHLTFEEQDELHQLAAAYQARLAGLPSLDPVPLRWLHLTLQGIGFTDEVTEAELDRMRLAAGERLARLGPLRLRFGPVTILAESVTLTPSPAGPVRAVHAAVRAAIAAVWSQDRVPPEPPERFWPHVSIAYSNRDGEAAAVAERLGRVRPASIGATVRAASLIAIHRDSGMYRWDTLASVPLGRPR
jgi:2'-5' RNA ligase